jgi:hypothetical protein
MKSLQRRTGLLRALFGASLLSPLAVVPLAAQQSKQESGAPSRLPLAPRLDAHATSTVVSPVTISGIAQGSDEVEVSGPVGTFLVPAVKNRFTASVPLTPDAINHVYFTGVRAKQRSAPAATSIAYDLEPPLVFIDFPVDGAELTTPTIDVSGRVADQLSGFMGLYVTVNGVPAEVDAGIGTNGTFVAKDVPLALGVPTLIEAMASDQLGNEAVDEVTVTRIDPMGPRMTVLSGDEQVGATLTELAWPIVVRVTEEDGTTPFPNKVVTFHIDRSDGRLSDGQSPLATSLQVRTDQLGDARAFWTLGSDSGCGNNRVVVTSQSISGTVFFTASATAAPASQLAISTGNAQAVETGSPAPDQLVAWVSDGRNGVPGVPVTFRVSQGSGKVNGLPQVTLSSGATGHVGVSFVAGPEPGNQRVEADFAGNTGPPATFALRGVARVPGAPTRLFGVVQDNAARPIGGASCVLTIGGVTLPAVATALDGSFLIDLVPQGGPAELSIDGNVATTLGGTPIPAGSFPSLGYHPVLVPKADNELAGPVLLPPFDPANTRVFDNTQDLVLTVAGIEGLTFTIRAGSMTLADGTVPSPASPATVGLNQVHADDVPMPLADGAAPPFAWTLKPAGALFAPPIEVRMPNMSGLPAGAIVYFLSFDHDTNRFEIVSTGQVTMDGSVMVSDPGSGIDKAGWGGICPPYPGNGTVQNCAVQVTMGDTEILCVDQAFTFTAVGSPPGGTYTWSGGGLPASGSGPSFTTQFTAVGQEIVTVTYSCSGSTAMDSALVDVIDLLVEVNDTVTDSDDFVVVSDPSTPSRPFTKLTLTLDATAPRQVLLSSAGAGQVDFSDAAPTLMPLTPLTVELYGDAASAMENDTEIEVWLPGGASPCMTEDLTVITGIKVRFAGNFLFMVNNNNNSMGSIPCNGNPMPLLWQTTPLPCEGLGGYFNNVFFEEGQTGGAERWTLASGKRPAIGVVVTGVKTFGPEVDLDGRDPSFQSGVPVRALSGASGVVGLLTTDDCDMCPPMPPATYADEDGVEPLSQFGVRIGDTLGLRYKDTLGATSARIWTDFPSGSPTPADEMLDEMETNGFFFPGGATGCVEPDMTYYDENGVFQCLQPQSVKQLFLRNKGFRSWVRRAWANWTSRKLVIQQESQFAASFIANLFDGAVRGQPQNVNGDPSDDVYAEGFLQFADYDWYTLVGQISKGVVGTPGGVASSFLEWPSEPSMPPSVLCTTTMSLVPYKCPSPYQPNVAFTDDPWN